MAVLWQDLRYGLRSLRKDPLFSTLVVLVLGLGIGACTAVFSVVDTVLLRPLPFADPGRLVQIQYDISEDCLWEGIPYRLVHDLAEQTRALEAVAVLKSARFQLQGTDFPETVDGFRISASLFDMLGARALLGRTFLPGEDQPGGSDVVVIGYRLWQRWFGGDPNLLGKPVRVNGGLATVVGIMPPRFQFVANPDRCEMWQPYAPGLHEQDQWDYLYAIGRVKQDVTPEQARSETAALAQDLSQGYPERYRKGALHLRPIRAMARGYTEASFWPLIGAVTLVLLISCANVANLLLSRAVSREKEVAIRASLGASRCRVMRLMLTESLLLSFLGGCLGLLFANWGIHLFAPLIPPWLPVSRDIGIDMRVLAFAACALTATGVGGGLVPACHPCKTDLTGMLKEGGIRSSAGHSHRLLRRLLVVSEVSLALILLVGAGLMIQTVIRLLRIDPGFNPRNLLVFNIQLPDSTYRKNAQRSTAYEQVLAGIKSLPGIHSVGGIATSQSGYTPEGHSQPLQIHCCRCTAPPCDYLHTMGACLLKGRLLTQEDLSGLRDRVVINEIAAQRFWPGEDPLGKRLRGELQGSPWMTVIGVVGTLRPEGYLEGAWPEVYLPSVNTPAEHEWEYTPSSARFVVRTSVGSPDVIPAIRRQLAAVDVDLEVRAFTQAEDQILRDTARQRLYMRLLMSFALLGLILAATGTYAVISYSVAQRTHEIGIRMALGARRCNVAAFVIKEGLVLTLIGTMIGVAGALALTRVLRSLLYGVASTDPTTYAAVSVLFLVVGLIACYVPARKASRIDPMAALRCE